MIKTHGNKSGTRHEFVRVYKKKSRSWSVWDRKRQQILKRDKWVCQSCGKIDTSNQIDHIKPLEQGGTDDFTNLQTLCVLCHKLKSSKEQGLVRATMYPDWMPKATRPLILVAGRPSAGKSTYVRENKGRNDCVIDLDLMANEVGRQLHDFSKEERMALIRIRNKRILSFIEGKDNYDKCWIVTAAGSPAYREFWEQKGAKVVVIDEKVEICERRVMAQDLPAWRKEERIQAIRNWK
jgi:5-methylcytosine-specific restriction protein A